MNIRIENRDVVLLEQSFKRPHTDLRTGPEFHANAANVTEVRLDGGAAGLLAIDPEGVGIKLQSHLLDERRDQYVLWLVVVDCHISMRTTRKHSL